MGAAPVVLTMAAPSGTWPDWRTRRRRIRSTFGAGGGPAAAETAAGGRVGESAGPSRFAGGRCVIMYAVNSSTPTTDPVPTAAAISHRRNPRAAGRRPRPPDSPAAACSRACIRSRWVRSFANSASALASSSRVLQVVLLFPANCFHAAASSSDRCLRTSAVCTSSSATADSARRTAIRRSPPRWAEPGRPGRRRCSPLRRATWPGDCGRLSA